MVIDIITIFPTMFSSVLNESILARAQKKGLIKVKLHNLRDFYNDPHGKIDDASYGGGGMVFKPEPLFNAVEAILGYKRYPLEKKDPNTRVILFSPAGRTLTQQRVRKFFKYERLVLIAPRYEGVDQRVRKYLVDEEISIGDYIVSGGELPAMVFVDSIARLVPGVVSDRDSVENESFEKGLLDYPHYTRPEEFRGLKVPEVLLSGDHVEIKRWRKEKALQETNKHRPDLLT
ncbi:MAG: tRNA (guanosine(37)-N1)-methyltransferase TrmD [Candidatus Omnitrophica bacterium]|jgi:tRNA (guanine37-N1)-methyltransferase|nr:tRNA (guanosine(37)-N1)-methyltransferase TrmD [Candidatus Omnitrophota bacterium]MDD5081536.1 tRNA (guanosine(37)-N1)-methyltransferase TrmD [Candidatus Omnitrophota bacterium]MDD5440965.1 tRNA (guanosine(37)-N1)-methyltransferase TrmD [Candidatus Omnitrophota bacterium]